MEDAMKSFGCMVLAALMFGTISLYGADQVHDDSMTYMDTMPTRGVISHVTQYVRDHMWCMLAVSACLGYIYVNAFLESIRPNPYEGPLKEAHERIAELEAAMMKYEQVYRVLKPVLKYAVNE
jgi:hypothetical protein